MDKGCFLCAFCLFLTLFDRKISRNFPHCRGGGSSVGVEKIHTLFLKASLNYLVFLNGNSKHHKHSEGEDRYSFFSIYADCIYSGGNKFVIFCFALLLLQILDNYQNQGHIWNLLVLTISKHPLHVKFDQVFAEIFEVKDEWSHSLIFMIISLTERNTIVIWIFCVKSNA